MGKTTKYTGAKSSKGIAAAKTTTKPYSKTTVAVSRKPMAATKKCK